MAFMEPQLEFGNWYEIETDYGTEFVPDYVIGTLPIGQGETVDEDDSRWDEIEIGIRDYCEGTPTEVKLISGYGARFSAPGYMDCTPWTVFETREEAQEYLDSETEDEGTEDGEKTFTVIEYSTHYAVRHNATGEEHPMGDGVDTLFDENGALTPGAEGFRQYWEDILNSDEEETLRAYFPDQLEG